MPTQPSLQKSFSWLFFLLLCIPSISFSDSLSTTGEQFLKISPAARAAGMGGAFTAVADDIDTMYWNTAGLASLGLVEINFAHISYFAGTNYEFGGLALPLSPGSVLGVSASFDAVPSFNSTSDPLATPGSASDLALSLGYARTFGENLALGIGGKFVSSDLGSSNASGGGLDAGLLLYTTKRDWTLGFSVQNIGQVSAFAGDTTGEKLPLVYRVGAAYRNHPENPTHFLISADMEKPIDSDPIFHGGGEIWLGDKSFAGAFRMGYSLDPGKQDLEGLSGASVGAGARWEGFELNYAWVPYGILGDAQRFSLTYRFPSAENQGTSETKPSIKDDSVRIQPEISDYKTGTLKEATFNLKPQARTDIKNWTLDITDPNGKVIQSFSGKGVPPKEISWDGRDTNGNIVMGGINAKYNFKTVDSQGQKSVLTDSLFGSAQISPKDAILLSSATLQPKAFIPPSLPEDLAPTGIFGVLRLPAIDFAEGVQKVGPGYDDYLDEVARLIRKYPAAKVYIEGHAYQEGNESEEVDLSQNRADSVLRYLVEKGKISPDNLYSRGHGDSAPLDATDTDAAREKNRRVEIVILTK